MPWNDQSNNGQGPSGGGPWGSGPRTPWGQQPRGPRGQGPDLEEMLQNLRERIRGVFGGRGGLPGGGGGGRRGPNAFALFAALAGTIWLASGVYIVGAGSRAVVTRFGAVAREVGPGLHAHIPFPVEHVQVESVTEPRQTKIGPDANQSAAEGSQMLTGDKSIIEMNFTVLWQVSNVADYAFNVRNPDATVQAVAESAMREVVGRREFDDVITRSRSEVELATLDLMQRMLNYYQAGIRVVTVQVDQAQPPTEVGEAFRDVIKAGQDQIAKRNEATRYANEIVPQARGQAAAALQEAEGYRERAVREAEGEAQRFSSVLTEYRKAPRVTRDRLYLETMERVYGGADKVIIDRSSGVVPYLSLDQLRKQQPVQPSAGARQGGQ